MTPTGHILTGVSIGVLCLPQGASRKRTAGHLLAFAVLATVPDFPLPKWGHDKYLISHSIFVNLLIIGFVVTILAMLPSARKWISGWPVVASGAIAWLSHLLLDSFYNHGLGVAIFWPFSHARLALPIPWFSVMTASPLALTPENMRIFLIELASYLPLLLVAIVIRRAVGKRH